MPVIGGKAGKSPRARPAPLLTLCLPTSRVNTVQICEALHILVSQRWLARLRPLDRATDPLVEEAPMLEQLLTTEQAATYLGTTRRTLEAWRLPGGSGGRPGPVFVKVGRLVRYRPSDLEAFVADGVRTNTGGGVPNQFHQGRLVAIPSTATIP